MVREMMQAFGQDTPEKPTLENYPFKMRARLIREEAREFLHAAGCIVVHGVCNTTWLAQVNDSDWPEMIDAICDLLVVTYGAANAMGIDIEPFFEEVHRSNMAKVGADGKVVMREDGKVLKPEGWKPPRIEKLLKESVERMGEASSSSREMLLVHTTSKTFE
jgi:predicted HAD superfamily Cof-like phosphohydrolase